MHTMDNEGKVAEDVLTKECSTAQEKFWEAERKYFAAKFESERKFALLKGVKKFEKKIEKDPEDNGLRIKPNGNILWLHAAGWREYTRDEFIAVSMLDPNEAWKLRIGKGNFQ